MLETRACPHAHMEKCDVPNQICGAAALQGQVTQTSPLTANHPQPGQVTQDLQKKLQRKQTA